MRINGEVGVLRTKQLRKAVEYAQFLGYDVKLYIGSGFVSKDFEISGSSESLDFVRKILGEN